MTSRGQTSTSEAAIAELRRALTSESESLAKRFRALFSLKHVATEEGSPAALEAMAAAFDSSSALLKHEVAYCLGQTKNPAALPYLRAVLADGAEDAMCRHEAAEAMGAIGQTECLEMLQRYRLAAEEPAVIRQTCELAVARILWEQGEAAREAPCSSDFASIDPAPSINRDDESVPDLEEILLDQELPLFRRYRAMFSLRNLASPPDLHTATPAVLALAKGLKDPSALFRHEIAFVFGQLSHPASIPALSATLADLSEESMVRHEAAEALGSLGDESGVVDFLKGFLNDEEQVVRDSVVVALDMADFETSGQSEYVLMPEVST